VGGLDPYQEFLKAVTDSFDQILEVIEEKVIEKSSSIELSSDGVQLEKMGVKAPSSTWTYLVNEHAFTDRLAASLVGGRNIGFAAGAAITGPLLMLWALLQRLKGRRDQT